MPVFSGQITILPSNRFHVLFDLNNFENRRKPDA